MNKITPEEIKIRAENKKWNVACKLFARDMLAKGLVDVAYKALTHLKPHWSPDVTSPEIRHAVDFIALRDKPKDFKTKTINMLEKRACVEHELNLIPTRYKT